MKKKCAIGNYEHVGKICWGNDAMRRLFASEEDRLWKYPGVRYGWDNEAYTYDALAEEDPELLALMKRLRDTYPDRIAVGAVSYGQPLSYYINGESNVRQLTSGIETDLKYFGVRPYVYNMSEHGMHAQIPQLIAQAGFTGAVMRTSFGMYGVNPEYPYSLINWYGLDPEYSVPTIPTYPGEQCHCAVNGYTHDRRTLESAFFGCNTMDNKILLDYPNDAPWGDLEEFRERFGGRIRNLIAYRADDPRQPEGIVAEYEGNPDFPFLLDMELIRFAGEAEADIRTGVNDFQVRMPWGFCGNRIWEKCAEDESRLYTLDLLCAVTGTDDHAEDLREAWKMLLTCQHHDVQICGLEEDADRCFARGDAAMERVESDLSGKERTFLFNPLPWERTDGVRIGGFSAVPKEQSEVSLCAFENNILETPFYRVTLSDHGGFASVYDKIAGRELFLPGRRSGILAGTIDGQPEVEVGVCTVSLLPGSAVVTDKGHVGSVPYEVTWRFSDLHSRVDCEIKADFDRQFIGRRTEDVRDPFSAFQHEEKLRMKFYPDLPDSVHGWRDQPFGAAETNRQSLECNLWAALSDGENGFALFNRGIRCAVRERDGALSVPLAYSMYYVWSGTLTGDFYRDGEYLSKALGKEHGEIYSRHFLKGTYTTHLAFLPFAGTWEKAQLHRRALEYAIPVCAVSPETADRITASGLSLDLPENAFVSSLYTKKGESYLRLYEMEGRGAEITGCAHGAALSFEPVDFFENPTGDPKNSVTLGAHAVRTFRLITE